MQEFGLSISGLLAFGGVGGLVIGLAAKDLLSNFFGGFACDVCFGSWPCMAGWGREAGGTSVLS